MVGDGLNWVTRPAAWQVEPLVSSPLSSSRVAFSPALARWYATLAPVMPPPITTAWARSATEADYREWRLPKLGKNAGDEDRVNRGHHRHGRRGPGRYRRRPRAALLSRLCRPDSTAVTRRRDQA